MRGLRRGMAGGRGGLSFLWEPESGKPERGQFHAV